MGRKSLDVAIAGLPTNDEFFFSLSVMIGIPFSDACHSYFAGLVIVTIFVLFIIVLMLPITC
jgi:hypothetical protein